MVVTIQRVGSQIHGTGEDADQANRGGAECPGHGCAELLRCILQVFLRLGGCVELRIQLIQFLVLQLRKRTQHDVGRDLAFAAELLQFADRDAHLTGDGLPHRWRLFTDGAEFITLQHAGAERLLELQQCRRAFCCGRATGAGGRGEADERILDLLQCHTGRSKSRV